MQFVESCAGPTLSGVDYRALDALRDPQRTESTGNRSDSPYSEPITALESNGKFCFMNDSNGGEAIVTDDLNKVIAKIGDSQWWWLDCTSPTEYEVELATGAIGGVHPLTLDILNSRTEALDTLQELKTYRLLAFAGAKPSTKRMPAGFKILMAADVAGVITFHGDSVAAYDQRSSAYRGLNRLFTRGCDLDQEWIVYSLLETMVKPYLEVVHDVASSANWVTDKVYVNFDSVEAGEVLKTVADTREKCVSVAQTLRGTPDLIQAVAGRCQNQNVKLCLQDLHDHVVNVRSRLEVHETQLGNTHRNWMAVTQMNTERSKSKVLAVIGQFVAFGTVLTPAISVCTAAHMNLTYPGSGHKGSDLTRWGVFIAVVVFVVMAVLAAAGLYIGRFVKRPPPALY